MSRILMLCVLIVALALVSVPSIAAEDRVIPECIATQLTLLRTILPEYLDAYTAISDRIGPITLDDFADHTDEVDELIADMHELQLQWRREGEGQMPDCVLAANFSATLGRLFDETLISLLLLDAGYTSFADWHANPIIELTGDLEQLLSVLHSDVATRAPTGSADFVLPTVYRGHKE